MVLVVAGLGLLGTLRWTAAGLAGGFMAVLGIGLGAVMQNLVLAVQNTVAQRELGVASSLVTFVRTMGGAIGLSALGTALSHRVGDHVQTGMARLGLTAPADGGSIPDVRTLPDPVRAVIESAYAEGVGHIFLLAAPFALIALVAVLLIQEVPLRTTIARADELVEEPVA